MVNSNERYQSSKDSENNQCSMGKIDVLNAMRTVVKCTTLCGTLEPLATGGGGMKPFHENT